MGHLRWVKRPSNGTIIGSVALFVAIGGTALAATGTLVNIADGTNSALIAHVNAQGQLRTSSAPEAPLRPITFTVSAYTNDRAGYGFAFATPTTAKIALDRITMTNYLLD